MASKVVLILHLGQNYLDTETLPNPARTGQISRLLVSYVCILASVMPVLKDLPTHPGDPEDSYDSPETESDGLSSTLRVFKPSLVSTSKSPGLSKRSRVVERLLA